VLHYLVRVLCAGDYNVRGRCQSLAYDRVCHRVQQRRTLARNGRDERHEWNEEGGEEGRARRRSEENAGGSSSYQPLTQLYCYHPRCASLSLSLCRSSGNIRRFFKRFLVYCIHYSRLSATLVNYERLHDKYKPKAKMQSVGSVRDDAGFRTERREEERNNVDNSQRQ
jgi:hypothetical protein